MSASQVWTFLGRCTASSSSLNVRFRGHGLEIPPIQPWRSDSAFLPRISGLTEGRVISLRSSFTFWCCRMLSVFSCECGLLQCPATVFGERLQRILSFRGGRTEPLFVYSISRWCVCACGSHSQTFHDSCLCAGYSSCFKSPGIRDNPSFSGNIWCCSRFFLSFLHTLSRTTPLHDLLQWSFHAHCGSVVSFWRVLSEMLSTCYCSWSARELFLAGLHLCCSKFYHSNIPRDKRAAKPRASAPAGRGIVNVRCTMLLLSVNSSGSQTAL